MEQRELLEGWISHLDSRGPTVDPPVAEAAYAVPPAAVWYSEGRPGEAAEVLAKTAFEVSKFVLQNGPSARDKDGQEIRDMKDYLYRGLCVVKTPSGSKFKQLSAGTGTDSLL